MELRKKVEILYGEMFAEEVIVAILCRVTIMADGVREIDPTGYQDQFLLLKNTTFHSQILQSSWCSEFEYSVQCYLLRRSRRIFLELNNIALTEEIISKRWNAFASNTNTLVKYEAEIAEQTNFGDKGL